MDSSIVQAADILKSGGLVAFPTETVYGLGADATNPAAVAKIYEAKGRPSFNPLIAHVLTLDNAFALGTLSTNAQLLAKAFWPGPMTLVVPAIEPCATCELARAGLNTIAIRIPSHPIARQLLEVFGKPIVAPSANRSGHVSPTSAAHVCEDLGGRIDLIIEGGSTEFGLESTIFLCSGQEIVLLRPGSITRQMAETTVGVAVQDSNKDAGLVAPGQMMSHYAPRAQMHLDVTKPNSDEAYLAFGSQPNLNAFAIENLSFNADLTEAAANLYAMLRRLDQSGAKTIAVSPIPSYGLGEAIRDRLARAAAPR